MLVRQRLRRHAEPPDRGGLSLELLLVFPAILMLVIASLTAGLWFYARNIAITSAQEGLRTARSHADPGDGIGTAEQFAAEAGNGLLADPVATLGGDANTIEITVTGRVNTVIPGLNLTVSQTARAPRERFTVDPGQ